MMSLSVVVVGVYIALFVWQAVVHRQNGWLLISILSWWLLGVFSASILPGIMGIFHWQNVFLAPLYVFLGALTQWRSIVCSKRPGSYLSLLAETSWMMHLVMVILLILVAWEYPRGLSVFVGGSLLQLYVWQPVFWILSQWTLMLLIALSGQTRWRIYWSAGVLVMLLWIAVYVAANMLRWV